MAAFNVFGFVRSIQTGKGISAATVILYSRHSDPLKNKVPLNFSGMTKPDGSFQFFIDEDEISEYYSDSETIGIGFRVMQGSTLVQDQTTSFVWTPNIEEPITISVQPVGYAETYDVSGYLYSLGSNMRLGGLSVSLFSRHINGNPPADLGFLAETDADGFFRFVVEATSLSSFFATGETIQIGFKVFNGADILLQPEDSYVWLTDNREPVKLAVDIAETPATGIENYEIAGTVNFTNGAVGQNQPIKLYWVKFRNETLLSSTTTNTKGEYKLVYNTIKFGDTIETERRIAVRVRNIGDTTTLSESNVVIAKDFLQIDFNVDSPANAPANFSDLLTRVTGQISGVAIAELNDADIKYLSTSLDIAEPNVQKLVSAHQYSAQLSVNNPTLTYALADASDIARNPVLDFREQEMRDAITNAIDGKIIPTVSQANIDAYISSANTFKVASAKAIQITGETFTLDNVLKSVFTTDTEVTNFLQVYNNDANTTPSAFWTSYQTAYGATLATQAKKGIALMAVTGFQPEVIKDLLTQVTSGVNIRKLAAWDEATWIARINSICTSAGRLCVPPAIKENSIDDPSAKTAYAKTLKNAIQDLYPLANVQAKLQGASGDQIIPDPTRRTDVITFLENNPSFDLRVDNAKDITSGSYNTTGVTSISNLKDDLEPFQRLLRVTGGKPEAVAAMKINGIVSAMDITTQGIEQFTANYTTLLGGSDIAALTYARAEVVDNTTTEIAMDYYQRYGFNSSQVANIQSNATLLPFYRFMPSDPNLTSLFGSLDSCTCRDCQSLFSPAAYLTDLLKFVEKRISGSSNHVYEELVRRRGDLFNIDLSCKNANTAMPYIDLVIEQLEILILKQAGVTTPASFQTQGTEANLKAYPEHIYKDVTYKPYTGYTQVYDTILSSAQYPENLPFSLALEEIRTYLGQLGVTRYDLMKLFFPYSATAPANGITADALFTESLGIPYNAQSIITVYGGEQPYWLYYGIKEYETTASNGLIDPSDSTQRVFGIIKSYLPNRPDVLIRQLDISFSELLQLLSTDFLNKPVSGARKINITVDGPTIPEDTCVIKDLQIAFTAPANANDLFRALHRFVRFTKLYGKSYYDLDTILRVTGITLLNDPQYKLLARVSEVSKALNIDVTYLAMWWQKIDTLRYINYNSDTQQETQSIYDKIFRNKSVINAPIAAFDDPANLPVNYIGQTALIAAFCMIKEDDVLDILGFLDIDYTTTAVTLTALSRIYVFGAIAKSLNYSVSELLDIFYILKFKTTSPASNKLTLDYNLTTDTSVLVYLEQLADFNSNLQQSTFSLSDISYVARNVDPAGEYLPDNTDIQLFYEGIRNELKKFPIYSGTIPAVNDNNFNRLANIVYQQFSKEFNIPGMAVQAMISTMTVTGGSSTSIVYDFISAAFVQSTVDLTENVTIGGIPMANFYAKYRLIYKIGYVCNKLDVKDEEFVFLYTNTTRINFNFATLPTGSTATQDEVKNNVDGLLRLSFWIKVRNQYKLTPDDFIALLNASSTAFGGTKTGWLSIIQKYTQWASFLTDLVGDSATLTNAGLLQVTYPTNFVASTIKSPQLLLKLSQIISWCNVTGLNPSTIYSALETNPVMADSNNIMLAAKGKYEEAAWLEIAKPLRDKIRKKQRDALVAYLIANPYGATENLSDKKLWRNENELYAYLLIDVEMDPCMITTRIRQAISSVQLYVDRIMLGIESENYNLTPKFSMSAQLAKQWETWRKWYRIWEANRKVFLYPENWLEPELRDGKSVFFEELETELLQDEFTNERAEDALTTYLQKLDGVSRLEPVGTCYDWEKGILHAFARSYGSPNYYHYRRLINNEWTPWERMDLDIQGNHIVPFIWNRRLYIFWLTFKNKVSGYPQVPAHTPQYEWSLNPWFYNTQNHPFIESINEQNPRKQYHIEISLNWSEYKEGEWLKQKIGKANAVLKTNPTLDEYIAKQLDTGSKFNKFYFKLISKKGQLDATEIIKSRIILYPFLEEPQGKNILNLWIMHPSDEIFESHKVLTAFRFGDNNTEPEVNTDYVNEWNFPAPNMTYTENMKFVLKPTYPNKGLSVSKIKNADNAVQPYAYNIEGLSSQHIKARELGTSSLILRRSEEYFKVKATNVFGNPLENNFFYEDRTNTFFARIVELPIVFTKYASGGTTSLTGATLGTITSTTLTSQKSTPLSASLLISKDQNLSLETADSISRDIYPSSVAVNNTNMVTYSSPLTNNNNAVTTNFKATTPNYYFQTFFHPQVNSFIKELNRSGIDGFMQLQLQTQTDTMNFAGLYLPTSLVTNYGSQYVFPKNKVDFDYWGTYSIYNWELFFHAPMMIAQRLSENQKFAEARKWFHYIFDPTSNVDDNGNVSTNNQRFWRFRPFYTLAGEPTETLAQLLDKINKGSFSQVTNWEDDPFKPHVIARQRILAYMKNVVMKYLDNLIAWGDYLFKQDTIESVNEATQLYILASNILGRKPDNVPSRVQFSPKSYNELNTPGNIDAFSNAKVKLESYVSPNAASPATPGGTQPLSQKSVYYFCLTRNDQLMTYWDTVADRLFKIRNCMSIDGQTRQLAIYDPPIDPAILVKAAAAGVDIASVLNDISSVPSLYRFSYIIQKANEYCNDVKSLGSALLSALEKKDAEGLALLRSSQEISIQEKTIAVKLAQVDEIKANIEALVQSKAAIQARFDYYNSRPYMNAKETEQMDMLRAGIPLYTKQSDKQAMSSAQATLPTISLQFPYAIGGSFGGGNMSSATSALSAKIGADIAINSTKSSMAQAMGGYDRRMDDWQFQAQQATIELQQVAKQIVSAELRQAVAEKELETQQLQVENSRAVDEYMRGKYTNEQLYSWMISQISTTYFQSYQLAYDMAKKAERCYNYELPLAIPVTDGFIKFGYWDSLKKGLLSAEKLQYDLRKLEAAYIENNLRELELTKHISLASTNPRALLDLIKNGSCEFFIPEELFDLDYPGHYLRRLKTVSITIPCIAGPYTTIACKVTLTSNATRSKATTLSTDLVLDTGLSPYMSTSSAQNDSGLFELNFKDERYLPFEGKGAVSQWKLQITSLSEGQIQLFDLETISDVILHLKYNARDAGDAFKSQVITKVNALLTSYSSGNTIEKTNLPRYFSLKHEYSTEWAYYVNDHVLNMTWDKNSFPFFCNGKVITAKSVYVTGLFKVADTPGNYRIRDTATPASGILATFDTAQTTGLTFAIPIGGSKNLALKIEKNVSGWVDVDIDSVFDDIFLVILYTI